VQVAEQPATAAAAAAGGGGAVDGVLSVASRRVAVASCRLFVWLETDVLRARLNTTRQLERRRLLPRKLKGWLMR